MTYDEEMAKFERLLLIRLLMEAGGNVCRAADRSNMHRNTFGRKMLHVGLTIKEVKDLLRKRHKRELQNAINTRPTA